jgi:mono/diheme cytochrome c family protein/uncharacterized membrane protein
MPDIPDLTKAFWQRRRSDAQLLASILDGKGTDMPPMSRKLTKKQARSLVNYVRTFAPTTKKPRQPKKEEAPADSFEERFRRLQEQLNKLKRQSRELSEDSPRTPSKPSQSPQRPAPRKSAPAAARAPAVRKLFRQHCAKCHGADGKGSAARGLMPDIPDLTKASWQRRRTDAQLLASILDGKGTDMPAMSSKLSKEQARGLVAYVRAFAPNLGPSGQKKKQESNRAGFKERSRGVAREPQNSPPAEAAAAQLPRTFAEKLIRWLGQFHPAAVHFPIGLLTAAAVAELLGLVTGKLAFDAISRYCLWFGALTAVVAGILGWFLGGFHLTDTSWVLMAHRWLGTSTSAWAGLVLVLSELSRRPDHRRARMRFRVALFAVAVLVLITGFFGGALVFGFEHYSWP